MQGLLPLAAPASTTDWHTPEEDEAWFHLSPIGYFCGYHRMGEYGLPPEARRVFDTDFYEQVLGFAAFFESRAPEHLAGIEAVAMDMWAFSLLLSMEWLGDAEPT